MMPKRLIAPAILLLAALALLTASCGERDDGVAPPAETAPTDTDIVQAPTAVPTESAVPLATAEPAETPVAQAPTPVPTESAPPAPTAAAREDDTVETPTAVPTEAATPAPTEDTSVAAPEPPIPPRALPLRTITSTVHVPANTPSGEQVYLLLKPFIDWWWTEDTHIPLTDAGDGTWTGEASVPEGALVQYVYDRWDEQQWGEPFKETREGAGRGVIVESRLVLVTPGLQMVEDTVETWNDLRAEAPVGRLVGRVVDAETGEPVMDADVVAGGMHSATFHDGTFEFQLAAGRQRITVWRALGNYHPESIVVDIEAGSATEAPIMLMPAEPVQVTFDVLLPEDTPPEAEIKLAGDVWQLGARQGSHPNFPYAPDGVSVPILERTAPGRAEITLDLHEGTSISYYYTIADGYAGHERPANGGWVFRSHVVGSQEETLSDQVAAWRDPGQSRLTVRVSVPPNTPDGVKPLSGGYWLTRVGERVGHIPAGLARQHRHLRSQPGRYLPGRSGSHRPGPQVR